MFHRQPAPHGRRGCDREIFAQRFGSAMLKMVFTDGFYHADPHPGNIFVLVGERVGFLDCGKVGRVDEQTQDDSSTSSRPFSPDVDRLTDELIRLCEVPPDLDRSTYRADVAEFVGEFAKGDAPIDLSAAFQSMFGIFAAITWWCRRGQHAPARPGADGRHRAPA
ncbi:MAG: AarF/UbiB family protein [Caldilineaceae bacterium]